MKRPSFVFALAALLLSACATTGPLTLAPARTGAAVVNGGAAGRWFMWVDDIADLRGAPTPAWFGDLDQRFKAENAPAYLTPEPAAYIKENLKRMLLDAGLEASSREAAKIILKIELIKFNATRDSTGLADELTVSVDYKATFQKPSGEIIGTSRVPGVRTLKTAAGNAADLEEMTRDVVKASLEALSSSDTFKGALSAGGQ